MSGIPIRKLDAPKLPRGLAVSERVDYLYETLAPATAAALGNETLTRERVDRLEKRVSDLQEIAERGLLGRLRWLLLGR